MAGFQITITSELRDDYVRLFEDLLDTLKDREGDKLPTSWYQSIAWKTRSESGIVVIEPVKD